MIFTYVSEEFGRIAVLANSIKEITETHIIYQESGISDKHAGEFDNMVIDWFKALGGQLPTTHLNYNIMETATEILKSSGKLEAVKYLKQEMNISLAEAKKIADTL